MEEKIKELEKRIEVLEENLGWNINNTERLKEIIEYLEEANINDLIEEMKKDLIEEETEEIPSEVISNKEDYNKFEKEEKKNVKRKEVEQ